MVVDDVCQSPSGKALKSPAADVARFVRRHLRMTQPRLVLPGSTVMVTRRTLRRHHLFRPDTAIRQLYPYTLAVCASVVFPQGTWSMCRMHGVVVQT